MRLAVKDPTASRDAASKADRLREIFAQFPEVEENLIRAYQSDDGLRAVSFTLAPLRYADGHYVRMLVGEEEPSADAAGKFLLYTTVGGGTEPAPAAAAIRPAPMPRGAPMRSGTPARSIPATMCFRHRRMTLAA